MASILAFGPTFANAGIIIAGKTEAVATSTSGDPCTDTSTDLGGIIIAGVTAAATYATGGIIIAGATQETCGIIIAG